MSDITGVNGGSGGSLDMPQLARRDATEYLRARSFADTRKGVEWQLYEMGRRAEADVTYRNALAEEFPRVALSVAGIGGPYNRDALEQRIESDDRQLARGDATAYRKIESEIHYAEKRYSERASEHHDAGRDGEFVDPEKEVRQQMEARRIQLLSEMATNTELSAVYRDTLVAEFDVGGMEGSVARDVVDFAKTPAAMAAGLSALNLTERLAVKDSEQSVGHASEVNDRQLARNDAAAYEAELQRVKEASEIEDRLVTGNVAVRLNEMKERAQASENYRDALVEDFAGVARDVANIGGPYSAADLTLRIEDIHMHDARRDAGVYQKIESEIHQADKRYSERAGEHHDAGRDGEFVDPEAEGRRQMEARRILILREMAVNAELSEVYRNTLVTEFDAGGMEGSVARDVVDFAKTPEGIAAGLGAPRLTERLAIKDSEQSVGHARDSTPTPDRRPDYRELLTNKLISQLEAGTAPWQKPWDARENRLPFNPTTDKAYRGTNSLYLAAVAADKGYEDPRWMTFRQAQAAGYSVRKGEKGTMIEFTSWEKTEQIKDEHGDPVAGEDGKPLTQTVRLERPEVVHFTVFNVAQIRGVPAIENTGRTYEWDPIERAELILDASGATIIHDQADRAYYNVHLDDIHLPARDQFPDQAAYYGTALHELGHWTGHPERLDREGLGSKFGSQDYAREELRAELASYFLSDKLGIPHDPGQHAAYVKDWVRALKEDKNEIFRASRDADRIADFVMDPKRSLERVVEVKQARETQRETERGQDKDKSQRRSEKSQARDDGPELSR